LGHYQCPAPVFFQSAQSQPFSSYLSLYLLLSLLVRREGGEEAEKGPKKKETMADPEAPRATHEDDNSAMSYDEGEASSADETAHQAGSAGENPKKRKREKYQKTS
jgi:hypothetical protein